MDYAGKPFDEEAPQEVDLLSYFKHLREIKKLASSSLWVFYSHVNCIMKNRYGLKLQTFPRLTTQLKSYDTDIKKKAAVFETRDIETFIQHPNSTPYWLVRKVNIQILRSLCQMITTLVYSFT